MSEKVIEEHWQIIHDAYLYIYNKKPAEVSNVVKESLPFAPEKIKDEYDKRSKKKEFKFIPDLTQIYYEFFNDGHNKVNVNCDLLMKPVGTADEEFYLFFSKSKNISSGKHSSEGEYGVLFKSTCIIYLLNQICKLAGAVQDNCERSPDEVKVELINAFFNVEMEGNSTKHRTLPYVKIQ